MGRSGNRKRRQQATSSKSGSNTSDTSPFEASGLTTPRSTKKKAKTVSTSDSYQQKLSKFTFEPRGEKNMDDTGDRHGRNDLGTCDSVFSLENCNENESQSNFVQQNRGVSNEDLMLKLCANGCEIAKLSQVVEELRGTLFELQNENDKLKKEVADAKRREEAFKSQLAETKFIAELADQRSEELSMYIRRNNLRIYGIKEEGAKNTETAQECEEKILTLFNSKIKVKVTKDDIEAVHRLGTKKTKQGPFTSSSDTNLTDRGIIVRFISRRVRDKVLYARRGLKGSRVVIVEDLTPRAYSLLTTVKSDKSVCQQAWTRNGTVIMKALNGKITQIKSLEDFSNSDQRAQWSSQPRNPNTYASSAVGGEQRRNVFQPRDQSMSTATRL